MQQVHYQQKQWSFVERICHPDIPCYLANLQSDDG